MTSPAMLPSDVDTSQDLAEVRGIIVAAAQGSSPADLLNRRLLAADAGHQLASPQADRSQSNDRPLRIAIVSLLFNWPSTGGGIVHTAELATFLARDGVDVCHFYAVCEAWGVGSVSAPLEYPSCAIQFDEQGWTDAGIQHAFREALSRFQPDAVIVTDSWNSKPLLAEAVSEFPYYLRLAALECICPLNNVRMLPGPQGTIRQCYRSQLATPDICQQCVAENQQYSGSLHRQERQLARFGTPQQVEQLRRTFANATGVLAVNPLIAALCEPYSQEVHVIPSGFDAQRFEGLAQREFSEGSIRLLFAGLVEELMKGFHILFAACQQLWRQRQDFELHVTAADSEFSAPFLKYRGWQDQQQLPQVMADCDIVIVPTVAQEALGRTAVEAMGASRPVVASRLGGLPYTVTEGLTGLLFEPGDVNDLAACLSRLMDHPAEAQAMGAAGRRKFLAEHTWSQVLRQRYARLFAGLRARSGRHA